MPPTSRLNRRQLLKLGACASVALTGCDIGHLRPPIRIATTVWPGYEFLYMARARGYLPHSEVKLVDMHSAGAIVHALAAGYVEGACLTLDMIMAARAEGLPLTVVALLDVSHGADVLLSQSKITDLRQLKGKRIGLEHTGIGAIMLHHALASVGLTEQDIHTVHLLRSAQEKAFLAGEIDALITYEPTSSRLASATTNALFSSRDIPNRILDVLAVHSDTLQARPQAVRQLVAAHFKAQAEYQRLPRQYAPLLNQRLKVNTYQIERMFDGIHLPSLAENHQLLNVEQPVLQTQARESFAILQHAELAQNDFNPDALFSHEYLPPLAQTQR